MYLIETVSMLVRCSSIDEPSSQHLVQGAPGLMYQIQDLGFKLSD